MRTRFARPSTTRTRSVPPLGIASTALVIRFSSDSSRFVASTRIGVSPAGELDLVRDAAAAERLGSITSTTRLTSSPARGPRLAAHRPRPVEQRSHGRRHLGDLFLDDGQARGVRRGRPELLLQQLHVSRDQIERRADLMRDVGGGLTDRRELLGAGQLLAQTEQPVIGLDELLVALLDLLGGFAHARLHRVVERLELGEHRVASPRPLRQVLRRRMGGVSPAITRAMISGAGEAPPRPRSSESSVSVREVSARPPVPATLTTLLAVTTEKAPRIR